MTMTGPIKTPLQIALQKSLAINNQSNDFPSAAKTAINKYINIVNTPSVADLVTLISAIEAALPSSSTSSVMARLKDVEMVALVAFASLKIGNPEIDLILTNDLYPKDDLGVTYTTIKDHLIANLVETNTYTVADFAATIFYTIKALHPSLSLPQLTADIQATIDSGVALRDLVNSIKTSLTSITNPSASTIQTAIYGNNIFSADAADLAADIETREALLNLIQIKNNLIAACDNSSTNNSGFADALYNSLLGLSNHLFDDRMIIDIVASVNNLGDLTTLKANIKANLSNTSDLNTTIESIRDAIFAENTLIPSAPHDLGLDIPPANTLLGLQYIREALMDATHNFSGTSTALATALLNAITSNGGGNSLTLAELANDIDASGDVSALATNIYAALDSLNTHTLTASIITGALYAPERIISGHKQNLINDLITEEMILNYTAMKTSLVNPAILASSDIGTLALNIYNNIGVSHGLSLQTLQNDITATINNGINFVDLKAALSTALTNAAPTAAGIKEAFYGAGLLIPADPIHLAADINAAETAIDYRTLISSLQAVCGEVILGNISTPAVFVANLESVVTNFASTNGNLDQASVVNEINFNIAHSISGSADLVAIATNIKTALTNVVNYQDYTSLAITAAIFNNIIPSHPTRLVTDLTTTETLKNLLGIKTAIINACNDVTSVTTAEEFATALKTAVRNNSGLDGSLTTTELTNDITATLNSKNILITDLASTIETNLGSINTNALTDSSIENVLYNDNAIISANTYEMLLDIEAAALAAGALTLKTSLLNYLQPLFDLRTDISSVTLGKGIINALKGKFTGDPIITEIHLNADISYAISQDENALGEGNFEVIERLIAALQNTGNSAQNIVDAIFSPTTLLVAPCVVPPCGHPEDLLDDKLNMLNFITASYNANIDYHAVKDNIFSFLNILPNSCTSSDIADAIVRGMSVSSPHLSVLDLKENIDATYIPTSTLLTTLKNNLLGIGSVTSATSLVNAIFSANAGGLNGPLERSTVNAGNLLTDIDNVILAINDYPIIINKIISNLSSLSGYTANDVAQAMINGVGHIADGLNGNILNSKLTQQQILDDINHSLIQESLSLTNLVTNLITQLNGSSAGAIAGAIYNSNTDTLSTATTNANTYNIDLQTAAAGHSSLAIIQDKFMNIGTYTDSTSLAYGILTGIISETGIVTRLTYNQLEADIADTLAYNNAASLVILANHAFTNIYNSGSLTTVNNMVNAVFGSNIQTTNNAHLLQQDLVNYELHREPTFYGNIASSFISNFAASNSANYNTANKFATVAVNTLNLQSPTWTISRVEDDVTAGVSMLSPLLPYTILGANLNAALATAAAGALLKTADAIANVIYSSNNLVLSRVDANAATSDIGANIPLYGGVTGLAHKVSVALAALPNVYDETDVATAIIETITPVAVNPSPHLAVADMAGDLTYTEGYTPISLTDLVAAIQSALAIVIANPDATATDLDTAIYSVNHIVPSNSDETNFETDIENAIALYNDYATVKTALGTIDSSSINNAVTSIQNDLLLPSYNSNSVTLANDITHSIVTTLPDLINVITTNVGAANIANVNTASKNLALAFFNKDAIIPINSVNCATDITNADEIDNAVTLLSAMGSMNGGVCTTGATHVVYNCPMSNGVATIGEMITMNNCTIASAEMAARACDKWASQTATDLSASYDGVNCSPYLGSDAASYCKAGLDFIVPV